MALYRTYRPATFAEVVGQEHVTAPLSRALDTGRINHAYLFSGPRGCGKTSSARILARSLNCVEGPTSTPCGTCASCVALGPGGPGNLDVVELDAASHGGVDDTRDLRDRAFYAPAESRYRVFIIDEAHMVSSAGFNALLKIVEEPPEHLIFIFATTEPEKVLTTIKSRTHHYPFRLLAPTVMRGLLENICAKERVVVAPEVYPLVIRAGGGSPRDSLSILDQLLAGAGDEGVTYERALSLLGVTDSALIDAAVAALAAGDGSGLFDVVEKVVEAGHDPRRFAIDLLDRFRDLILVQAVPDAAERGLVEAPEDQIASMHQAASQLGPATLTRYAEVAHAALGEMRGTTSPRLLLEVMCARLLLPSASSDDAALLQRVETLERRPAGSGAPAAVGAAPSASAPAAPAPTADEPAPRFVRPSQQRKAEEAAATAPAPEPAPAPAPTPEPEAPTPAVQPPAPQPPVPQTPPAAPVRPEPQVAEPEPVVQEQTAREPVITPPAPEPAVAPPAPEPVAHPPVVSDPRAPEPPRQEREQPTRPVADRRPLRDDEIPPAEPPMDDDYLPPPDDGYSRPAAKPAPAPAPEPEPEEPTGLTVDAVSARWPDIRAAVRKQSSVLEAMLSAAFVHQVEGSEVVLGHPHTALVGRLADDRGLRALTAAVVEVFGSGFTVGVVHAQPGSAPAPSGTPAPKQAAPRKQTFTRPSRPRDSQGSASSEQPPEPEEPAEPAPPPVPDEELTDAERDEMVAQAQSGSPDNRLDPDQVALDLLKSELGARPVE
ncbi:DNA polymerase III subunit gamma and tau [Gordonia sp. (in: high G+C Gram-positive bacteria)]|uniref:DNA polymerase III subunit gamma and tau n=1 Tax=Gordonia sp. (in: high G+C Gram-positive bacteria) TaxID=84139 RepID=UPI0016B11429|nr:DNA polymerase III subunit gamma and tau [Gordonia sp. (in: high G+C Gram-positive bacteria)]NLG45488.1 DNA polymerase III subunit gamma and tau [Gordonia sp. (in: high G+C Gram-positive bacteria)]